MPRPTMGELAPPFLLLTLIFCQRQTIWAADTIEQHARIALSRESADDSSPAIATLETLLRDLILSSIDEDYVDDRHWNGFVDRFDGFHVDGLVLTPRIKTVKHGFWHRYRARLIHPENTLDVSIRPLSPRADGKLRMRILLTLRARCEATFVWWTAGVKGLNGTAVSDATLRLRLIFLADPRVHFSLKDPLPEIELRPRVRQVDLHLLDVDLRRLGVFDGLVVKSLGDGSREALESLVQSQEERIRRRLNDSLQRQVSHAPNDQIPRNQALPSPARRVDRASGNSAGLR